MRIISRFSVFVIIAFLVAGGLPARSLVWAQTPAAVDPDGVYALKKVEKTGLRPGSWEDAPEEFRRTQKLLYLSKYKGRNVYSWGDKEPEYSEYRRITGNLWFLCASRWSGEVEALAGQNKVRLSVLSQLTQAGERFKYTLEMEGKITGDPLPKGAPSPCSATAPGSQAPSPSGVQTALGQGLIPLAASGGPLLVALQAQGEGEVRRVNGQLLLSVKNTSNYTASGADRALWACHVTKGSLTLDLAIPESATTQSQEVFVWPDGHFQVVVNPGALYSWRIRSAACQSAAQSDANMRAARFTVPQTISETEEKLLLACYIAQQFTECDSWWLQHP